MGLSSAPSRRSTRETVSTVVWVDGHRVLKANNYSLEDGEGSVWDSEVDKSIPPPKKPATAYMIFCSKFRKDRQEAEAAAAAAAGGGGAEESGGDADAVADADANADYEEAKGSGSKKRKAMRDARLPTVEEGEGKISLMDEMVATWRSLSEDDSTMYVPFSSEENKAGLFFFFLSFFFSTCKHTSPPPPPPPPPPPLANLLFCSSSFFHRH